MGSYYVNIPSFILIYTSYDWNSSYQFSFMFNNFIYTVSIFHFRKRVKEKNVQHVEFTSIHVVWVNWKEWVYFLLQLIGAYFNEKDSLLPVHDHINPLEITLLLDHLISTMGFPILMRQPHHIELDRWSFGQFWANINLACWMKYVFYPMRWCRSMRTVLMKITAHTCYIPIG